MVALITTADTFPMSETKMSFKATIFKSTNSKSVSATEDKLLVYKFNEYQAILLT